jgi:galacturan 1,4-alpha-galacturonidase
LVKAQFQYSWNKLSDSFSENVYVYNASMISSSDAARIKVWPGVAPGSTVTNAGGGTGYVRNVTYDTMHNTGDDCKL